MWKHETPDATGSQAFRSRETAPPLADRSSAGAPARASERLNAEQYVAYACQVWNRDRNLAARHLHEALRLNPSHPQANNMMAGYFYHAGLLAEALQHSMTAVELAPDDAQIATDHALLLDTLGQVEEAMTLIQRHLQAGKFTPELVLRYASLAEKAGTEQGQEALDRIRRALSTLMLSPIQRKSLHFHASKLLNRMKRYDEAFEHVRRMHRARSAPFDPHAFRQQATAQAEWFTAERTRSLAKATHGWGQPVFIVGMPRSGTTLVEQILDSHPDVFGAGELLDFTHVIAQATRIGSGVRFKELTFGGYHSWLAGATSAQLDGLAGLYLSRVASFAPGARYITDKLPFNWMHLGLISRVFPEARIIHLTRNPLDTCLSCYMTHFHESVVFSTDLTSLGMQYVDHVRLMRHWRGVLDLPTLELSYEALVAEPETHIRLLLQFLDLPWDERCLNFHENTRVAHTASVDQVRRPLYKSSVRRWKNYQAHLGPLLHALKDLPPAPRMV